MIAPENSPETDPRLRETFLPHFFPLADLDELPRREPASKNDRVRLQFLSVYYEINVTLGRLLDAGARNDRNAQSDLEQELASLEELRDHLEDYYAPLGVIAEATIAKGFAVNLAFTFPNESRWFHEQASTGPRTAELKFTRGQEGPPDVAEK